MTEPSKWTPERALEWLRDVSSRSSMSFDELRKNWGAEAFAGACGVAIEALEAAVAEIARQKEMTEQARRDGQEMTAGLHQLVAELRAELAAKQPAVVHIENGRFIGGAGDVVVQGSYEHGIQAAPEQGQAGPSDEEIAGSIKCVWTWGCKRSAHALQLLARRAGVRL